MPTASSPAPTAEELISAARRWIDTPVRHYGRAPSGAAIGVGCDCLNLILAAGLAVGAVDVGGEVFEYGRLPNPERLVRDLGRFLIPLGKEVEPEDAMVATLSWNSRDLPMHLAIMATAEDGSGRRTFLHAHPLASPKPRVVETGFAGVWPQRLCGFWRYPRLA